MGTSQFGHIDTYSRKPKPGKNGSSFSAQEILAEADRTPTHCPHIHQPMPPKLLEGIPPSQLSTQLTSIVNKRLSQGARRPRDDIHVLAAAVYSWPEHTDDYNQMRFEKWVRQQLEWHRKNVGHIDSAVLHLDEAFPHIHVYSAHPDARSLIPGHNAKREVLAHGGKSRDANKAFRAAMMKWQDQLYEEVGKFHGLDRLGPKRQRLSRIEWQNQKQIRQDRADALQMDCILEKKSIELLTNAFQPAKPLPHINTLPAQIITDALKHAGNPNRSLFSKKALYTTSQIKDAIKHAAAATVNIVRADESRRYAPIHEQLEELAGMSNLMKELNTELSNVKREKEKLKRRNFEIGEAERLLIENETLSNEIYHLKSSIAQPQKPSSEIIQNYEHESHDDRNNTITVFDAEADT